MADKIIKQNIKYYDTEASVYDKARYGSPAGKRVENFQQKLLEKYLSGLDLNAQILETGCGTGRFLPYLHNKGYHVTGVDISPGMLQVARKRIEKEASNAINLFRCNIVQMPFKKNVFDAIVSILVINLIQDYHKALAEAARVLKPGGVFILSVPNLSSVYFPVGLYVNLRGKSMTSNVSGHRYSHWFSCLEIKNALNKSGFTIEDVQGQPPHISSRDGVVPLSRSINRWLFAKSVYIKARYNV